MLKTIWQRSGLKLLVAGLLTWTAASLVGWVGLLNLPEPWNAIAAKAAAVLVEVILLVRLMVSEPSADARSLPSSVVSTMPIKDRTVVALARVAKGLEPS